MSVGALIIYIFSGVFYVVFCRVLYIVLSLLHVYMCVCMCVLYYHSFLSIDQHFLSNACLSAGLPRNSRVTCSLLLTTKWLLCNGAL